MSDRKDKKIGGFIEHKAGKDSLFDRDIKTIGKYIVYSQPPAYFKCLKEEMDEEAATVAKIATVQKKGEREVLCRIEHYSLDVTISVHCYGIRP